MGSWYPRTGCPCSVEQQGLGVANSEISSQSSQITQIHLPSIRKDLGVMSLDIHQSHLHPDLQMTSLTITERNNELDHVITGPEAFQETSITVVDGLKIMPRPDEGSRPHGTATLFRLAGSQFGQIHQLENLRVHDGRLHGTSPEPLEVGALVTIGWQDPVQSACRGVIAMSLRGSDGWFITIELDSALAA